MSSSGGLESHVRCYPYGMTWSQSATPATDRLFTGHQQMGTKSGTYYANARFYSADIGRFPQPDSVVGGGYAYAGNNPTNYIDPTGNDIVPPCVCPGSGLSGTDTGALTNPNSILPPRPDPAWVGRDEIHCIGLCPNWEWPPGDWNCYGLGIYGPNSHSCFAPGHPKYNNPAGCLCLGFFEIYVGACGIGDFVGAGLACDVSDPFVTSYLCMQGQCGWIDILAAGAPFLNSGTGRLADDVLKSFAKSPKRYNKAADGVIFAGPGSGKQFRDAHLWAAQYGGKASEWVKVGGRGVIIHQSGARFNQHWVENIRTRTRYQFKLVPVP